MFWWNTNYSLRRQIIFTADPILPIKISYPLFIQFNYTTLSALRKIRPDFADIQVLYWTEATQTWTVLARDISVVDTNIVIKFNAVKNFSTTDSNYYVYMGNPYLMNAPSNSVYSSSDYVISTSSGAGYGLTFTRPVEDWADGLSLKLDSKATFTFFGVHARIVMIVGPDKGHMKLTVDNQVPVYIDTYAPTEASTVVYITSGLVLGKHYLRMEAVNDKNPSSSDVKIELDQIQYSRYTQGITQVEEINSTLTPIRIVVGP